ncbi:MAG TPA: glycosyltransferase [Acidimicrobiales bacterium]|nr:glycosyltransferase [Acidimicrobiales bacterium]
MELGAPRPSQADGRQSDKQVALPEQPAPSGFYVDVGSHDAALGSATEFLYEVGWSGLNVSSWASVVDRLQSARRRDVSVCVQLGTVSGSTRVAGPEDSIEIRPQARLQDLLERHATRRPVDFLRLFSPGTELEVLSSAGLGTNPPAVVLVQTQGPSTGAEPWRLLLSDHGYRPVETEGGPLFAGPAATDDVVELVMVSLERGSGGVRGDGPLQRENAALKARLGALLERDVQVGDLELQQTEALFSTMEHHRALAELALLRRSRALKLAGRVRHWAQPLSVSSHRVGQRAAGARQRASTTVRAVSRALLPAGKPADLVARSYRPGQGWSFDTRPMAVVDEGDEPDLADLERALREALSDPGPDPLAVLSRQLGALSLHSDEHVWWPRRRREALRAVETALCDQERRQDRTLSRPPSGGDGVLVDARCLQDPHHAGRGIGRHARMVVEAVTAGRGRGTTYLLTDPEFPPLPAEMRTADRVVIAKHEVRQLQRIGTFVQLSPMTVDSTCLLPVLVDPSVHRCAVVYDLIPLQYQQQYLSSRLDRIQYLADTLVLSGYDHVLPISEASAGAVRQLASATIPMTVTGVAADMSAVEEEPSALGVPGRYVVVPSGAEARKNLPAALGALAVARMQGAAGLRLVVYGSLPSALRQETVALSQRMGLHASDVEFLPWLSDRQLKTVFREAAATMVPSFAEGFSMPVAESLSCATPVVASDIAVHRELVGAGWWLAPPADAEALGTALMRVLEDPHPVVSRQRATLGDRADAVAVTRRIRQGVEPAAGSPPSAADGHRVSRRGRRPRIAVVTPWPPQHTGVAECSAFTLEALTEFADVTVFTGAGATARDQAGSSGGPTCSIEVRPLTADAYLDPSFDRVLTVLGNNQLHVPMLEYLSNFGGASLAHDDRMLDVYDRWLGHGPTAALLSTPQHPVSAEDVPEFLDHLDRIPNRGFGLIATQARPVVVHSRALARHLAVETGVDAKVVPFVPHNLPPVVEITEDHIADARRRCGMSPDTLDIVTLGIVDFATKGVDIGVYALAWLRNWGIDARLHVLGSLSEELFRQLKAQAGSLGVGQYLRLYGRYSWTSHDTFLLAADVAVQLRLSPILTISGAAADCAAFGVPSVVSRTLADEMELPSYVHRLSDRITGLHVAEKVAEVSDTRRTNLAAIERERRTYLDRFSARNYALGLLSAIDLEPGR